MLYCFREELLIEQCACILTRWFTASWMWAECYMYRRIWESLYHVPELRYSTSSKKSEY
jgi:hypothetical protein